MFDNHYYLIVIHTKMIHVCITGYGSHQNEGSSNVAKCNQSAHKINSWS